MFTVDAGAAIHLTELAETVAATRFARAAAEELAPETTVVEEVDCGSFVRRTMEYSVEPDERITAFLCLPDSRPSALPGVYCFHQHGGNRLIGKSEVVGLSGDPTAPNGSSSRRWNHCRH